MKANSIELDEASWEGFKNVAKNFTDAARRSVGASVGLNRNALYQFTGELVQNAINDISAAIDSEMVDPNLVDAPPPPKPTAPTPPAAAPAAPAAPAASPAATKPSVAPTTAPPSRPTIGSTPINPMQVRTMQNKIARDKRVANMPPPSRKTVVPDRRTPAQISRMRRAGFSENSTYDRLNAIFESILNEVGETDAATPKESISSYLLRWLTQYTNTMGNFSNDAQIKALASQVQATWAKDKGKAALQKMAQNIWSKSRAGGAAPSAPTAGGDDTGTGGEEPTAPTAPTGGAAPTAPTGGAAPTAPTGGAGRGTASEPESVTKGTQALKIINTMIDRSDLPDLEKIVNASLAKIKKMDSDQFRNLVRLFSSGSYDPLKTTAPSNPTSLPPGHSPTAENRRIVRRAIK